MQKLPKGIVKKCTHHVGQVTSRERGELVTMIGIICANGNVLPLMLFFSIVKYDVARMIHGTIGSEISWKSTQ